MEAVIQGMSVSRGLVQDSPEDAARTASDNANSVCMVVLNSVSHDARVLKEAATLVDAGYPTTILGIVDAKESAPESVLENGVRIKRISYRATYYHLMAQALLVSIVVSNLLWIALVAATPGPVRGVIVGVYTTIVVPAVPILCVLALNYWLLRQYGKYAANRMRVTDAAMGKSATAIKVRWRQYGRLIYSALRLLANPKKLRSIVIQLVKSPLELVDVRMRQIAWERCFLEVLAKLRPTIVHCHDAVTLPIGHAYKKRHACKLVYDSHELATHQGGASAVRRLICHRIQRRCSPLVDGFVTVNDSIGRELNRRYSALPPACVVKNATMPLAERVVYDGRLHEAAELPPGQRILLFQGGLSRGRGLELLVRSAPLLPDDWAVVVMGWGSLEAELRSLAGRVAGKRVRFVPPAHQSDLPRWTAGASLGSIFYENTCLNHWYCSPNKLWEYPNAGVPILASKFPEIERVVGANNCGWLLDDPIRPEHVAALIASIDDEELARRRENALQMVARDNWSVYAERLCRCYGGILGLPNSTRMLAARAA